MRVASGGGYGDPLEREPQLVQQDVKNGLVSMEAARDIYGVVLDEVTARSILAATQELRKNDQRERDQGTEMSHPYREKLEVS